MVNKEEEIWKEIPGYEGKYEASNFGRLRNKNFLILKQHIHNGYYSTTLWKNGKGEARDIHALVARAFLTKPNYECCVDHIDEKKLNNNLSNLHYVHKTYNQIKRLSKKPIKSGYHNVAKCRITGKWMASVGVFRVCKLIGRFDTAEEASLAVEKYKKEILAIIENGDFDNEEFKRQKPYYRKRLAEGKKDL